MPDPSPSIDTAIPNEPREADLVRLAVARGRRTAGDANGRARVDAGGVVAPEHAVGDQGLACLVTLDQDDLATGELREVQAADDVVGGPYPDRPLDTVDTADGGAVADAGLSRQAREADAEPTLLEIRERCHELDGAAVDQELDEVGLAVVLRRLDGGTEGSRRWWNRVRGIEDEEDLGRDRGDDKTR
jgi:hypothetical protein